MFAVLFENQQFYNWINDMAAMTISFPSCIFLYFFIRSLDSPITRNQFPPRFMAAIRRLLIRCFECITKQVEQIYACGPQTHFLPFTSLPLSICVFLQSHSHSYTCLFKVNRCDKVYLRVFVSGNLTK